MYVCTEEVLELLWKANSRRLNKADGDDEAEEEADASYARSPAGTRGVELQELIDSDNKQTPRSKIKIPQTAVFKDGVLKVWYFSQNGVIKKKMKKSLERSTLLREFIKEARPGRPVAVLICTQQGADSMYTTQTQIMDEVQFLTVIKNAFSTRMTAIIQEYIAGAESLSSMAWVKNPPHDPRLLGLGCLQAVWTPTRMDIVLRGEEDLAAITHHCVQRIDKDGRLQIGRLTPIVHDMGNRKHGSKKMEAPVKAVGRAFKRYPTKFDERSGARSASPSMMHHQESFRPGGDEGADRPNSRGIRESLHEAGGEDEGFSRVSSALSNSPSMPRNMDDLAKYHAEAKDPARQNPEKPAVQFPILTSDDAYNGRCQVIALDERTAVRNACYSVSRLLGASRTSSGEVPELKRFLAYFKRSHKGKVYMLWCSAAILLPSENISVRTVAEGTAEYDGIKILFQNLVLNPGWYAKFCALEADAALIKAFDLRASTMDLAEWMNFLRMLKMLPSRLSKQEATKIFKKANRVSGVSDEDRNELTFSEWKVALSQVAAILGIDWDPIAAAARFGELLMNPRLFKRFAQLPPCDRVLSDTHMHFHQFFKLLQTYAVCPQLVSKEVAETAFRKTLREHNPRSKSTLHLSPIGAAGSPLAGSKTSHQHAAMGRNGTVSRFDATGGNNSDYLITQDGFRFALSYISENCGINIHYPEVYIKSEYASALLGSDEPPSIQVDDPVNRFFSPQRRVKNGVWNKGVGLEDSGSSLGLYLGSDGDSATSLELEQGFGGSIHVASPPKTRKAEGKQESTPTQEPRAIVKQAKTTHPSPSQSAKQLVVPVKERAAKSLKVFTQASGSAKKILQMPDPEQAKQKRRLLQLRQGREPTFEDVATGPTSPTNGALGTADTAAE